MDESEEGRDDARDADPAGEDSDTTPDADAPDGHEEDAASPDSDAETPFAFDESLPDAPESDDDADPSDATDPAPDASDADGDATEEPAPDASDADGDDAADASGEDPPPASFGDGETDSGPPTADWRGAVSGDDTADPADDAESDDSDPSDADPADDAESDDTDDSGGLTRVDPPDDPPRPERPPRPSGGGDGSAGGLRRIDDSDDDPAPAADGPAAEGDGSAVGHGAHPAESHEPLTGVGGTPPAGHAAGAPTPGEDTDGDADGDADAAPESVASAGAPAPVPSSGDAEAAEAGADAGASEPAPDADVDPDSAPSPSDPAVGSAPAGTPSEPVGADFGDEGPPDDEEMPLSAHVEEMIRRLAVVVIAAGLATAFTFPVATRLINAMWYGVLPANVPPPTLYGPLEKLLAEIKVASLGGILIALPVVVYETYLFMRPGLYPTERRYFLAAVPTSLVLGSIGMAFAYFLVLPLLFQYFITYSESAVDALPFGLQVTFDLIVSLLGAFALVFQIPLLIMLAVMIGVVTRRWLERQRLLFWGLFVGVGFFISLGDATGTAPLIIGATMIGLFEGTLALLRWTGRN